MLLMIILGGIGHLRGAVLGAAAFALLKEYATPALVGSAGRPLAADPGLHDHRLRRAAAKGLIGLTRRLAGTLRAQR